MYAWIDGENWGGDACPPLTELHGYLADPETQMPYGHFMTDEEAAVIRTALLHYHQVRTLPLQAD
jgi:hypothetical protein